jgi:hypothetical protein
MLAALIGSNSLVSQRAYAANQEFVVEVIESTTGWAPVADATVDFLDSQKMVIQSTTTNTFGRSYSSIPPGVYSIKIRCNGCMETNIAETFYGPDSVTVIKAQVTYDVTVTGYLEDSLGNKLPFVSIYSVPDFRSGLPSFKTMTNRYGQFSISRRNVDARIVKFKPVCESRGFYPIPGSPCSSAKLPDFTLNFSPYFSSNSVVYDKWLGLSRDVGSLNIEPTTGPRFFETKGHASGSLSPRFPAVDETITCNANGAPVTSDGFRFIIPSKRELQQSSLNTYTIQPGDMGEQIVCLFQAEVPGTGVESIQTEAANAAVIPALDVNIGGVRRTGQTISVNTGPWIPGISFAYQWLRNQVPIDNATSKDYLIAPEDVGQEIQVDVTGSHAGYLNTVKRSKSTIPYEGDIRYGTVLVEGTFAVGDAICASPIDWDPTATLAFQWRNILPIENQTTNCYVPRPSDSGGAIQVTVTAKKFGYLDVTIGSDFHSIGLGTQTGIPTPVISGEQRVGKQLTASAEPSQEDFSLAYLWYRDGAPIFGANQKNYLISAEDLNRDLTVRVTFSRDGYNPAHATSQSIRPSEGRIENSPQPQMQAVGGFKVGSQLNAQIGNWDSGIGLSFQWMSDGVPVTGANSSSYLLSASDLGHKVAVSVTGSAPGFSSVNMTSPSNIITSGLMSVKVPGISGTVKVGKTLTAVTKPWVTAAKISYQWLLDAKPIKGASGKTLKVLASQKGRKISLRITQAMPGYSSATATTAAYKVG